MSKLHRKLFGVTDKGWPSMPNSRKQLLVGGIICILIWPGIGLTLLAPDQLSQDMQIYAVVSPFLLVTVLGIYFMGQATFASRERPQFTTKTSERKRRT